MARLWLTIALSVWCAASPASATADPLADTELLYSLVVARHGDRTPESIELLYYTARPEHDSTYYPFGLGALTNSGKERAYSIGQLLRDRFDGFLSRTYFPEEIEVRTTNVARTKMTALAALAALYRPEESQQWGRGTGQVWQPIPYTTKPEHSDELVFFSTCPRYFSLLAEAFSGEVAASLAAEHAQDLEEISYLTGNNLTSLYEVMLMSGAIAGQKAYGILQPEWTERLKNVIAEMEDKAFGVMMLNTEMIKLSGGSVLRDFLSATSAVLSGQTPAPSKVKFISSHDVNVVSVLSAAVRLGTAWRRPAFGATLSLELRRNATSGEHGIAAVYASEGGEGPIEFLKISGCGDRYLCPYHTYARLAADFALDDYAAACAA